MSDLAAKIVQGDDVSLVFNVKDKDDVAIDLTGVLALTFKAKLTITGTAYISKSLGAGVEITDATAGEITVTLTNDDTSDSNLPADNYLYELQITGLAGNISTLRDFDDNLGCLTVLADLDN